MPKILKDPKNNILNAARKELETEGVKGFNIRPVAKNSGVAIGTIYNYYGNKIGLIVGVILNNWELKKAELDNLHSLSKQEAINASYDTIKSFHDANCANIADLVDMAPDCFHKSGSPKEIVSGGVKDFLVSSLGVNKGAASLAACILFLAIHDEDVDVEKAKALALTAIE